MALLNSLTKSRTKWPDKNAWYGRVTVYVMEHPKLRGSLPQTDYVEEQDENKPIKVYPVNYRHFGNKEGINWRNSVTGALKPVMGCWERPWSGRRSSDPGRHSQALPHSIPSPAWARPSSSPWGVGAPCTQPVTHSTGAVWGHPSSVCT